MRNISGILSNAGVCLVQLAVSLHNSQKFSAMWARARLKKWTCSKCWVRSLSPGQL